MGFEFARLVNVFYFMYSTIATDSVLRLMEFPYKIA